MEGLHPVHRPGAPEPGQGQRAEPGRDPACVRPQVPARTGSGQLDRPPGCFGGKGPCMAGSPGCVRQVGAMTPPAPGWSLRATERCAGAQPGGFSEGAAGGGEAGGAQPGAALRRQPAAGAPLAPARAAERVCLLDRAREKVPGAAPAPAPALPRSPAGWRLGGVCGRSRCVSRCGRPAAKVGSCRRRASRPLARFRPRQALTRCCGAAGCCAPAAVRHCCTMASCRLSAGSCERPPAPARRRGRAAARAGPVPGAL